MTAIDIDVSELLLCARYGEMDELKEELARLVAENAPLDAGAVLARGNDAGNTALHMASANGHLDIVQFLLEKLAGVHVNAANEQGNTPMHWAALNGHVEIVTALIAAGADLTLTNKAGKSPLIEAQDASHENVAVELLKHMDPDMDDDTEDVQESESSAASSASAAAASSSGSA
ncbi:ankyrin repeat-containing domain protein [Blastocladiella britannica]|nr:ankyrin repeat-containing domain protein [Blastocladiella britannica]